MDLKYFYLFNESLIPRARNYLCDEFLRSEYTHLMFIDADIHFDPRDVLTLAALDKDIIGGPYPKKCIAWEKVRNAVDMGLADKDPQILEEYTGDYVFNPVENTKKINVNDPVEVLEIGTGFMMIKRQVFDDFREAFPNLLINQTTIVQNILLVIDTFMLILILSLIQNNILVTFLMKVTDTCQKDYFFCQFVRKIGYKKSIFALG